MADAHSSRSKGNLEAVVLQTLDVHAGADTYLANEVHNYISGSVAAQTSITENYVGLPL